MAILIPILATTLFVLLKHSARAPAPTEAASAELKRVGSRARPQVQIAWAIPPIYEPHGRDPMRVLGPAAPPHETPVRAEEPGIELLVTGILHSDDRPAAIVNTQVVRERQQIAGTTVVKIDTDGVEFEHNGHRWRQTVSDTAGDTGNP